MLSSVSHEVELGPHNLSYSPNFRGFRVTKILFSSSGRLVSDSCYDSGVLQLLPSNIMFSDIFEINLVSTVSFVGFNTNISLV